MDDGYLHIAPNQATCILDHLISEFRNIGIELNIEKLQVRAPRALPDDGLPPSLRQYRVSEKTCLGTTLQEAGSTGNHGLTTSLTPGNLEPEIGRLKTVSNKLEVLVHAGLPIHIALSLLRVFAGPAVQHALRAAAVSEDSAEHYDKEVAQAWGRLLQSPVDHDIARLWLPARLGGMGAFSARHRAAPSVWSAWTLVMSDVLNHLCLESPEELLTRIPALAFELETIHKKLVDQGAPASITGSSVEHAVGQPVRLPRIMGYIHKRHHTALKAALSDDQAAFL